MTISLYKRLTQNKEQATIFWGDLGRDGINYLDINLRSQPTVLADCLSVQLKINDPVRVCGIRVVLV